MNCFSRWSKWIVEFCFVAHSFHSKLVFIHFSSHLRFFFLPIVFGKQIRISSWKSSCVFLNFAKHFSIEIFSFRTLVFHHIEKRIAFNAIDCMLDVDSQANYLFFCFVSHFSKSNNADLNCSLTDLAKVQYFLACLYSFQRGQ